LDTYKQFDEEVRELHRELEGTAFFLLIATSRPEPVLMSYGRGGALLNSSVAPSLLYRLSKKKT
jgi:hypothetical protein